MLSSITHILWVAQTAFTFVNRALAVNSERLVLFGGEALINFLALEDRLNRDANTGARVLNFPLDGIFGLLIFEG